ncbi:phosphate transport system regulatory protein PhoU [Tersicoccus solisilvae]|uniref:Phosphate-specific transport system accessory protein PhoU n=1 Tax=Tersicoccus solisilvae TaxID=1882339 RepID=A0ABQ1PP58_9MICC|nr:phosphate signaling complex protein PhoU [Tersicoccus solisilvae]GGD00322.1 phosphate transport system regulatory protein PhoU [Tersicoccus solisilvae]
MRKVFQAELHQVGDELIQIATLVRAAVEKAATAYENADVELAEDVIAADARIDFLQTELDERAIDILARQGPVASDLRMIVGALRMSTSLERMGDLARHVAQLARMRYPHPVAPPSLVGTFEEMARLDADIAGAVVELLDTRDLSHATRIQQLKGRINELHRSVFDAVGDAAWAESPARTADVVLASRYFERFGDHGVSVSRKVTYLVTGEWDADALEGRVGADDA